jgi:hypothetical protein
MPKWYGLQGLIIIIIANNQGPIISGSDSHTSSKRMHGTSKETRTHQLCSPASSASIMLDLLNPASARCDKKNRKQQLSNQTSLHTSP